MTPKYTRAAAGGGVIVGLSRRGWFQIGHGCRNGAAPRWALIGADSCPKCKHIRLVPMAADTVVERRKATIMATAISNIATSNAAAASNTNQVHSASVAKTASTSVGAAGIAKDDTVKISVAASIKLMHHQGLSDSIIASRVGMSVKQVDTYLPSSTQTTSTAEAAAAATPSGSVAAAKAVPSSTSESTDAATATATATVAAAAETLAK